MKYGKNGYGWGEKPIKKEDINEKKRLLSIWKKTLKEADKKRNKIKKIDDKGSDTYGNFKIDMIDSDVYEDFDNQENTIGFLSKSSNEIIKKYIKINETFINQADNIL